MHKADLAPEFTVEEIKRRAAHARSLLADGLFQEATAKVRANLLAEWEYGKTVEAREAAHARLRALKDVIAHLQTVMVHGEHPDALKKRAESPKED
jgi:5-carboxymethyl-2-hydroxymuconate isomerase